MNFSIIMPAYNAEENIKDAIDSVLNQNYKNWELIIIDDGSTDSTKSIIEDYVSKDDRIFSYPNVKNIGVSKTRNRAVKKAKYDWLAFLDSDDIWDKEKLLIQANVLREFNTKLVFSGCSYIDEKGNPYPGIFEVPENVNFNKLLLQNYISTSSVVLKKDLFEKFEMGDDKMHEDYALWLQILKDGYVAYGVRKPLVTYRISSDSKSGNKLNSFRMTYLVHKNINTPIISRFYYTVNHLIRAGLKHYKIRRG